MQKGDVITYLLILVDVKRLFFFVHAVVANPPSVGFGFPYGRIIAVLCILYYSLFLKTTLFSPYIIRLLKAYGAKISPKLNQMRLRGLKMVC